MTDDGRGPIIVAGPLDGPLAPGPSADSSRWGYLPALDGVRAFAVVAVVLFHFWPDLFPGGFVGVDVFFVMSGFLITGILQAEHRREGSVDLRAFWGRRIRRLVPAVVVLVVVTAVATVLTGTGSWRQLADSLGALTWTTNIVEAALGESRIWLHNGRTTLDHLWSLAIEEQFYLVWPPVALLLLRRLRAPRVRVAVVAVLIVASAAAMGWIGGVHAYFRTDTRAFELLAGAALALAGWTTMRPPRWLTGALAVAGAAGLAVVVALVRPGDAWMYPWGFLLITAAGLALVAAAVHPPVALARLLGIPAIAHLGRVSYGVYLWHIPVQRLLSPNRMGIDGPFLHLVRFAVLAVVVEASYRYVEEPFRRKRLPLGLKQVAAGYLAAGSALLLLVPATTRDVDGQWDAIDGPPKVEAGQRRVLVIGDLIGAAAASGLADDDSLAVWSLVDPGCPATVGIDSRQDTEFVDGRRALDVDEFCRHWVERVGRGVRRFRPDVVVVGGGYWDTLATRGGTDDPARRYREVLAEQVGVAGAAGAEVRVIRLADWSEVIDPAQRPRAERLAAVADYNAAVDLLTAGGAAGVIDVSGVDGWDDLRDLDASALG